MENASKALIIAGSILVSIVIITLGVMIVNNVTDTIRNSSNLSSQEIIAYNSQFEAYEGLRTGAQVRALCDLVRSHNNGETDTTRQITLSTSSQASTTKVGANGYSAAQVIAFKNNIKSGYTYKVDFGYDANSGLIIAIGIVQQN